MSEHDDDTRLAAWIDANFDDEVRFLQALVRVPTDTPPGDNAPHAEATATLLEGFGFAVERHPVPDAIVREHGLTSITNLVVRRRYGAGPTIALNAHGDVVPPGEGWRHDPYGGEVDGGRIYGRWPGFEPEQLFERRDLAVTTDFRDVLGELVSHHLGQSVGQVFPGYKPGEQLGLLKT